MISINDIIKMGREAWEAQKMCQPKHPERRGVAISVTVHAVADENGIETMTYNVTVPGFSQTGIGGSFEEAVYDAASKYAEKTESQLQSNITWLSNEVSRAEARLNEQKSELQIQRNKLETIIATRKDLKKGA